MVKNEQWLGAIGRNGRKKKKEHRRLIVDASHYTFIKTSQNVQY
jgi:hypothetical protein